MYKIINWYTKRFPFPHRGWKFARSFLRGTRLYKRSFCKKLHNGTYMYVMPSEHIQQQLFWYGYYEKDAILTWERLINHNAVVFDIGANAGYYSLVAAPKAESVFAFEPAKPAGDELRKNIQLNQFINIYVQPVALSAQEGEACLYLSSHDNTGMTGLTIPENFSGRTETVALTTLDQWATTQGLARVDCIKMDVEGAEMDVLTGATQILQQYKPVIFIEIIAELLVKFNQYPSGIYQFLLRYGYFGYEIIEPGLLKRLNEPKEGYNIVFLPIDFKAPVDIRFKEDETISDLRK